MADPVPGFLDQPGFADAVRTVMTDLLGLPPSFMDYMVQYNALNGLPIPLGQVIGYGQQTQATRVHLAANQSVANNSQETILFDTVDYDYGGLWDATNHKLVIKIAGKYLIGGGALFDANATGTRIVFIKQGTGGGAPSTSLSDIAVPAVSTATVGTDLPVVTSFDLAVNDTLAITVIQNSGGALNVLADTRTNLWVVRVGP